MLFKFLKNKITLDVFTHRKEVLEFFTLDRTNKFIPDWFKKTPINNDSESAYYPLGTLKGCYGIKELFKKGFTIPLWSDLAIRINNKEGTLQYQFADFESSIDFHVAGQWKYYASPEKNIHFKIISPWKIKEKTGVQFLCIDFSWDSLFYDYKIMQGIINFKENNSTHINGFFSLKEDIDLLLPAHKPLVHFIPLSDKNISLKHHLISSKEFDELGKQNSSYFINRIRKAKKCPFKRYTKNI